MKTTICPKYLAGVLDSDGSFTITKRHKYRNNCNYTAIIQLTWTDSSITQKFMKTLCNQYGGSFFKGKPSESYNYKNSKNILKYCATGHAAEKICSDVINYLFLKKKQCANILKLRKLVSSFNGNRPIAVTNKLEQLYKSNRILNSKNGKLNESS